jgi:hypothetical protein
MSLGNSNISLSAIKTETGLSSNKGSELVGASGLNKYSFYAPGSLSVDSNKDIVLTPPAPNMKAGDFRSYNNSAVKPSTLTPGLNLTWGPGGAYCSFVMNYKLEGLNLYAFAYRGDYITMDFYASTADRSAGSNLKHRQSFVIPIVSDTPLIRHTRQSAYKPSTTGWIQCNITGFDTTWLSSITDIYVDTYISDSSHNRKINFGEAITDGYSSLVLQENVYPRISTQNTNNPVPPSGYTVIFPQISAGEVPVCSYGSSLDQALGQSYSFNIVAKGIYGSSGRIVAIDSTDIILTLDGVRTVCATGVALSYGSGYYCSGTLAGGGTWNYGKIGELAFENAIIQAVPLFTQC